MSEFQEKVVIVTGGAKGIGGGITRAFAREGAHVLCADVDVSPYQQPTTNTLGESKHSHTSFPPTPRMGWIVEHDTVDRN